MCLTIQNHILSRVWGSTCGCKINGSVVLCWTAGLSTISGRLDHKWSLVQVIHGQINSGSFMFGHLRKYTIFFFSGWISRWLISAYEPHNSFKLRLGDHTLILSEVILFYIYFSNVTFSCIKIIFCLCTAQISNQGLSFKIGVWVYWLFWFWGFWFLGFFNITMYILVNLNLSSQTGFSNC